MIDVVSLLRIVIGACIAGYAVWQIASRARKYLPALPPDTIRLLVEVPLMVVLVVFVVVGVPTRTVGPDPRPVPTNPDELSGDLLTKVAPVAAALSGATDVDRATWASAWEGAARVVEMEGETGEPVLTNTRELRAWTIAAMDVAWKRLGGVRPGAYPDLAAAVEAYLADPQVLGKDDVLLDSVGKKRYAAACRALAYAGRKRG